MRISLPAALSTRTARVGVVAAALAVAGVTGAASASASVAQPSLAHPSLVHPNSNTFHCAGSSPEVCVGIDYSGTFVQDVQVQAKIGFHTDVLLFSASGPHGSPPSIGPFSTGPGWTQQITFGGFPIAGTYNHGDTFCGSISENNTFVAGSCVNLP